jgi:DNA repair photolyase
MAVTYKEYQCKSMLRMHKFVDNWFWESASISPYKACEHGCNYCDGRSERYHASEDFDNIIYVKINAIEVLKKELDRLFPKQSTLSDFGMKSKYGYEKIKPVVAISSGISDAYQPAEEKYGLTRKILELLLEYEIPIYVMTKSDLVLRDLDLLKDLNETSWCNVSFSLSTADKKVAAIFEPKATSPKKRFEAMKKVSKAGILTGVTYMPIIPYISDSVEQLEDVIRNSKENGAQYILAASMTMRDLQSKRFYETIKKHYPHLVEEYQKLYVKGYQPDSQYLQSLYINIKNICKKYDMPRFIPRYIPEDERKTNFQVSTHLLLISYFLGLTEKRYESEPCLRMARVIENLDEDIRDLYENDRLDEIRGINKNLKNIIAEYLKTGKSTMLEELKN